MCWQPPAETPPEVAAELVRLVQLQLGIRAEQEATRRLIALAAERVQQLVALELAIAAEDVRRRLGQAVA